MDELPSLSLLGGPLQRLGRRAGLVRGENNTIPLGVALGLSCWLGVMILASLEGLADRVLSLAALAGHVRLLLVIPLMFVCETVLAPRLDAFVRTLVRSGVIPDESRAGLAEAIARVSRLRDHWLPEALALVATVLVAVLGTRIDLLGTSSGPAAGTPLTLTLTGEWYWLVCLSVFRFLLLRWAFHLGLWVYFLRRVARLKLHLVSTHPDGAGGLGYLEVVQTHFIPLVLALSTFQAAIFAEDFFSGELGFEALYPTIMMVLLLDAVLFLGPLFVFAPKLWACRVKGLSDYMDLAARYTNGFEEKWVGERAPKEQLLGTPDLQSLADLRNSVEVVRTMRAAPVSRRLILQVAGAALVPLLPLLLLRYPLVELSERLLSGLTGL